MPYVITHDIAIDTQEPCIVLTVRGAFQPLNPASTADYILPTENYSLRRSVRTLDFSDVFSALRDIVIELRHTIRSDHPAHAVNMVGSENNIVHEQIIHAIAELARLKDVTQNPYIRFGRINFESPSEQAHRFSPPEDFVRKPIVTQSVPTPYLTAIPDDYPLGSTRLEFMCGSRKLSVFMERARLVLYETRAWHRREQKASPKMHPAIGLALQKAPPADWQQLLLEWPHVADMDDGRLAYTRDDRSGEADRQTVTSVGKYLTRHFPLLPEHIIRDIAAMFGGYSFEIVETMDDMLDRLSRGPSSCMVWRGEKDDMHPYRVYDPSLGWSMAIRMRKDVVMGRCLLYKFPSGRLGFVRSYARNDGGYSGTDEGLEMWLTTKCGAVKMDSWEGAKMQYIQHKRTFLAPYLDGDVKRVMVCESGTVLVVNEDGEWECESTSGFPSEYEPEEQCDCCHDHFDPEDMYTVGVNEDTRVCQGCLDSDYVNATSLRGDSYYIHMDNAVYVDSQDTYYDLDYLSHNNIVELDNGDYEHLDYAVYLEGRSIYVHSDDDCVVYCEHSSTYEHVDDCVQIDSGDWALRDDCVQCEHDDTWYLADDVTLVTTSCNREVHPDHADQYETEEN